MTVPRFWRELPSRYNLVGNRCTNCGTHHFPPRGICTRCHRESIGKLEPYRFSGQGTVVGYTTVHQAQQGYELFGPYIVALVELAEGARLTTQLIDVEPEAVCVGQLVRAVFRKLGEDSDSGIIFYGTKFTPVEDE